MAKDKRQRPEETRSTPPRESQERLTGRAAFSDRGSSATGGKGGSPPSTGRKTWLQTHGRDLRFLALFLGFLAVFYVCTLIPGVRESVFPAYLRINSIGAVALLNVFGEQAESRGNAIVSPRFQVSIERGCDAIEPSALFCAAVLATRAPLISRLSGVLIGTTLLMVLNFVRILSLYYTGAYARWAFDVMHLDVWQAMFIFLALVLWLLWASRLRKQRVEGGAHAVS